MGCGATKSPSAHEPGGAAPETTTAWAHAAAQPEQTAPAEIEKPTPAATETGTAQASSAPTTSVVALEKAPPASTEKFNDGISSMMVGVGSLNSMAKFGSEASGEWGSEKWSSERLEAYEARQKKKMQKRDQKTTKDYLSNVPEVEQDIPYRFTFIVAGAVNMRVVQSTCASDAATSIVPSGKHSDATSANKPPYRCLCTASNPNELKPKLAKLVFKPIGVGEQLPICTSRLEALQSVIVFPLIIDQSPGLDEPFADQLDNLDKAVSELRKKSKPKHRPVRAVLLCFAQDTPRTAEQDNLWAQELSRFEDAQGDLWKFGPMPLGDGDGLHSTFTEMATSRIEKDMTTGMCATVLNREEENEDEGDDAEEDQAELTQSGFLIPVGIDGSGYAPTRSQSRSSTLSGMSEGCHMPPLFEAERSGSESSWGAQEFHMSAFGECMPGSFYNLDRTPPSSPRADDFTSPVPSAVPTSN